MSSMFNPTSRQLNDFLQISSLEDVVIKKIIEDVQKLYPVLVSHDRLLNLIEESLGESKKGVTNCIMRQAVSLNVLSRQSGIETNELLSGIVDALTNEDGWDSAKTDRWKNIESDFQKLIDLKAFHLAATAVDLSYEYANLYRSGRILTDIRPCFTKDAKLIEGAVVSYTFRLRYDDTEGEHELSIAMDHSDVKQLIIECDRALTKAKTASDMMVNQAKIATIITGE